MSWRVKMKYVIDYEVCALVFILIISIRFFMRRRFDSQQNSFFGFLLVCCTADILFDIASVFMISYPQKFSIEMNMTVNMLFYFM